MKSSLASNPEKLWEAHGRQWRDPAQIVSQWREAGQMEKSLLEYKIRGDWWETLGQLGATLLVTREYEHLVIAVSASHGRRQVSFHPLPHPSGLVVNRKSKSVYIASTRNPNQVYELRPIESMQARLDVKPAANIGCPLMPLRSWFFPGSLYIHDLALIGDQLYANAVGQNAVVALSTDSGYRRVWWPRCIEKSQLPVFGRNHLQLNSIAAGKSLRESFFSASCDSIGARRPGHRNFAVNGRGVIFSGRTREPIVHGLTRPHSARLKDGTIWVNNSGYGEVGFAADGQFHPVTKLGGWTRGLCFCGPIAFVGTSRVIPRFRQYAPGLEIESSECGVHAIDTRNGRRLGSIIWPTGNQIFAIDWISSRDTAGFPFQAGRTSPNRLRDFFYAFDLKEREKQL